MEQVLANLRRVTPDERAAIREELDGHIEDHICDLLELGYDEKLAWTLSDEAINLDMPVVVTESGELAVIARIGSFAASDYYYAALYPFS